MIILTKYKYRLRKLRLLRDFIKVNQGQMSVLFFCNKWDLPYDDISEIAYVLDRFAVLKKGRTK